MKDLSKLSVFNCHQYTGYSEDSVAGRTQRTRENQSLSRAVSKIQIVTMAEKAVFNVMEEDLEIYDTVIQNDTIGNYNMNAPYNLESKLFDTGSTLYDSKTVNSIINAQLKWSNYESMIKKNNETDTKQEKKQIKQGENMQTDKGEVKAAIEISETETADESNYNSISELTVPTNLIGDKRRILQEISAPEAKYWNNDRTKKNWSTTKTNMACGEHLMKIRRHLQLAVDEPMIYTMAANQEGKINIVTHQKPVWEMLQKPMLYLKYCGSFNSWDDLATLNWVINKLVKISSHIYGGYLVTDDLIITNHKSRQSIEISNGLQYCDQMIIIFDDNNKIVKNGHIWR